MSTHRAVNAQPGDLSTTKLIFFYLFLDKKTIMKVFALQYQPGVLLVQSTFILFLQYSTQSY